MNINESWHVHGFHARIFILAESMIHIDIDHRKLLTNTNWLTNMIVILAENASRP
jgi:hypothetical protein